MTSLVRNFACCVYFVVFSYACFRHHLSSFVRLGCRNGAFILLLGNFLHVDAAFFCASVISRFWDHKALYSIARISRYHETRWAKLSLKTQAQTTGPISIVIYCLTIASLVAHRHVTERRGQLPLLWWAMLLGRTAAAQREIFLNWKSSRIEDFQVRR